MKIFAKPAEHTFNELKNTSVDMIPDIGLKKFTFRILQTSPRVFFFS